MDITIERGTPADVDELEQLYNDLTGALGETINYPGWQKGEYPTRQDAQAGIDDKALFVARSDGRIVGSVILNHSPAQGYDTANWQYDGDYRQVLVIHTLAVHPACTKLGIGSRLLDFADSYARSNGIRAIRLDVYETNLPAMRLYEHCGYRYISTADLGLGDYGLQWFKLYEKLIEV